MTTDLNRLLHNRQSRRKIWTNTRNEVEACVKDDGSQTTDLNRSELINQIHAIWEKASSKMDELHEFDARHIKEAHTKCTLLFPQEIGSQSQLQVDDNSDDNHTDDVSQDSG